MFRAWGITKGADLARIAVTLADAKLITQVEPLTVEAFEGTGMEAVVDLRP